MIQVPLGGMLGWSHANHCQAVTMLSEANLQTAQASEWLAELCRQFQDRAAKHPELGIEVDWSETGGSVDFGWGRCVLQAGADALNLQVEADQLDELERLQEL